MKYEPVAYDKSITCGNGYKVSIRRDAEIETFTRPDFASAVALYNCFPDDVYEGGDVGRSVFYQGGRYAERK